MRQHAVSISTGVAWCGRRRVGRRVGRAVGGEGSERAGKRVERVRETLGWDRAMQQQPAASSQQQALGGCALRLGVCGAGWRQLQRKSRPEAGGRGVAVQAMAVLAARAGVAASEGRRVSVGAQVQEQAGGRSSGAVG